MKYIITENECTGCGACYNICPEKCIKMVENKLGEIVPEINNKYCIHCNLCKQVCPQNELLKTEFPKKCYVAWSKNEDNLRYSASGGIGATLSLLAFNREFNVYGCDYNSYGELFHFKIDSIQHIERIRGSKYSQSIAYKIFREIKYKLNNGEKVLFFGTPCQISGLKKFLMKEYKFLFTVDLVCHGTPPNKYLKEYLNRRHIYKNITKISFRGEYDQKIAVWVDRKLMYLKDRKEDIYFKSFYANIISRNSCYLCKYANPYRISDITIGDFWGLKSLNEIKPLNNRPSLVLLNTKKGIDLFNMIKNYLVYEERAVDEGIKGNGRLNSYPSKNKKAVFFQKLYPIIGFDYSIKIVNLIGIIAAKLRGD